MKRLLLAIVLAVVCPLIAQASHIHSTKAEQTLEQMIDRSGLISRLTVNGQTTDSVSPGNQGRLIYDRTNQCFAISENSGAYGCLVSSGSTSSFTPGSVIFAGSTGELAQDNANFFWNDTLNALQVGPQPLSFIGTALNWNSIEGDSSASYGVVNSYESTNTISIVGLYNWGKSKHTSGFRGSLYGMISEAVHSGAGTVSAIVGAYIAGSKNSGAGAATITYGLITYAQSNAGDLQSIYVSGGGAGAGAVNNYGIYIDAMSGATNNWAILTAGTTRSSFGGSVGIGTTTPTNILSFGGNAARIVWMERHTTSNTAGNNLTVQAGGATSAATDKGGGELKLTGGTATGTGGSVVSIYTSLIGTTGTSDNAVAERFRIDTDGHMEMSGSAPTVSACGTDPAIVGVDNVGRVTVGTGGVAASCTVTFNKTWTNKPACIVDHEGAILLIRAVATTTTLTIDSSTPLTASMDINYICLGRR